MNASLRTLQINLQIKEIEGWDSNFSKNDFVEGAKNAAVTISSMLQESNWKELKGLLTRQGVKIKRIKNYHFPFRKEFKRLQTEVCIYCSVRREYKYKIKNIFWWKLSIENRPPPFPPKDIFVIYALKLCYDLVNEEFFVG